MKRKKIAAVLALSMTITTVCSTMAFAAETIISNKLEATFKVIAPAANTVVKDNPDSVGLVGSNINNGSWKANGNVLEFYIDPSEISDNPIKISDIESISYKTNKKGNQGDVDFFLSIYTNGTKHGWYEERLNAEPMYSNGLNAPANQWNTWSTEDGNNQLVFFDGNYGPMGYYNSPTLSQIQEGEVTWENSTIDYREQKVQKFKIGTGSAWAKNFTDAYLDDITITLKNGISVTFDLQPSNTEKAAITAVNSVTDIGTLKGVLADSSYSAAIGISSEVMGKFNEMPDRQGRQQAVAEFIVGAKPQGGYTDARQVKEAFEYSVGQEYNKFLFINAVDGAQDGGQMKTALQTYAPILNSDRQDLINKMKAAGYTDAMLEPLAESDYTTSLKEVSDLIAANDSNLVYVAQELLAARNATTNHAFFGVEPATAALRDILDGLGLPVTIEWNWSKDEEIVLTTGEEKDTLVTVKIANGVTMEKVRYRIDVTKQNTEGNYVAAAKEDFEVTNVNDSGSTEGINDTFVIDTTANVLKGYWGPTEGFTLSTSLYGSPVDFDKNTDGIQAKMTFKVNTAGTYKVNIYAVQVD